MKIMRFGFHSLLRKQKNRLEEIFQSLIKNQNTNNKLIFNAFYSNINQGFVDVENKIAVYTDHQIF